MCFSTFDVTQGDTQNDTQGDTQGGTQDVPQEIELDVWIEDQIRKNSKVSLVLNPSLRSLASVTRRTFTPAEVQLIYTELGEP